MMNNEKHSMVLSSQMRSAFLVRYLTETPYEG